MVSDSTALTAGESRTTFYMYFVYIIECKDKSFYTGITNDLNRRFNEHKSGVGGHYTSSKQVSKILYTEKYPNRSSALKREAQIKKWTRAKKEALIAGNKELLKNL
ncbi:MAG: GIY-YIG nuclease family protein [Patescibacteria group bacterium]